MQRVAPYSQDTIIGELFTLHNVENTGAFLGMGSDLGPVLKNTFTFNPSCYSFRF